MTILVTGGAGYIGSQMAYQLVDSGERVVVLDNLSTGFDWAIPPGVPAVVGDVGDARLLDALMTEHRVRAILHFAASVVVPESVADPLRYYRNNTVNSRSLIEAAVRGGVEHFIFSSTAAVYGEPSKIPVAADAPPRPMSPYGSSKLMAEIMLRDAVPANRRGVRRISSRSRSRPRSACGPSWKYSARITRRRTVPASATISMSAISPPRIPMRSDTCGTGESRSRSIAATAAVFPFSR